MREALKERYINFFTDFGFKRLFGSDPTKACLIDFLSFFKAAEIAKLEPVEREAYEKSLKYYRDMKNVIDTAAEERADAVRAEMSLALTEERRQKEEERRQKEEERRQKEDAQKREEEERRQNELLKKKLIASGMTEEDIQKMLNVIIGIIWANVMQIKCHVMSLINSEIMLIHYKLNTLTPC